MEKNALNVEKRSLFNFLWKCSTTLELGTLFHLFRTVKFWSILISYCKQSHTRRTMGEISSNIIESQKIRRLYKANILYRHWNAIYISVKAVFQTLIIVWVKNGCQCSKNDLKWPTEMERYKARQTVFEFRIIYVSITFKMNTQELAFVGFQSIGKRMMGERQKRRNKRYDNISSVRLAYEWEIRLVI